MADQLRASIVVNNYNYGRFLPEAIESALAQTSPNMEVIVVDDGSTDNSAEIIAGYGNRIVPLVKENGGQTSALNAGFARSTGDVLLFLDADDFLLPTAMKKAIDLIRDPEVVHVHWHLLEVDEESKPTGKRIPAISFPQGNLRDAVIARGPDGLVWSPTSGNAWRRSFLAKHFPLPSIEKKCGTGSASADARLSVLAPLYGQVERIAEPQGCYRTHGNNDYAVMSFARKLSFDLVILDELCELLAAHCSSLGITFDREALKQNSWLSQLKQAITELLTVIPQGTTLVLVDDDTWGLDHSVGISPVPFLERDGKYSGPPQDDETAIRELARLQRSGAQYIAFAWSSFWWLEHYQRFHQYLRTRSRCILECDCLVIFDLR